MTMAARRADEMKIRTMCRRWDNGEGESVHRGGGLTIDDINADGGLTGQLPYHVLRGRVNGVGYLLDERIMPYLEAFRFESVALILIFYLKYNLISALFKRWHPETHTFHFSCGECTITLEDVALQLGLPIDSFAVMGLSTLSDQETLCYDLLRRSPSNGEDKLTTLIFSWMKANFEYLPNNATKRDLICPARAYIMHIIRRVVMPDANTTRST
ncbi:hypothetical protein PVK06_002718 [Gossypium arboreum]|uniref:Aminotransferase-like plant mobile domain-containing protein n=1 Tax=Gossypium arboreum TaxID=29729 RepID=A0ABR0R496_GOSAR|nr:hypothetical protein PVK06_002718 [Gossypium arboreum]